MINMGDFVLILLELISGFIEARKYKINLFLFFYLLLREYIMTYLTNFLFLYYFIIHMCIQGLGHFSPLPPPPPLPLTPPLPSPPTPSIPSRNYFALISNFVEETV
jgi:hypothetical protein